MTWWRWVELTVVLLPIAALVPLVGLYVRRRWLSRQGGMFDCAVRRQADEPGKGWMLGVARYHEGSLEWFRVFSLSWRPKRRFRQGAWEVVDTQPVNNAGQGLLYTNQRIVQLAGRDTNEVLELAMDAPSVTGFASWLEGAGPGRVHYGNTVN